jgi:hypothetical protein
MVYFRFLRGFTGKYRCRIYNAVLRFSSTPQVSQVSQASSRIHIAGSCRMRDIYRTRTYGLLQVSFKIFIYTSGFSRFYIHHPGSSLQVPVGRGTSTGPGHMGYFRFLSRSSSTPQVSQGFTGII